MTDAADTITDDLALLVDRALQRDPAQPAIEYERRWYDWGELRALAGDLRACLAATGAGARQPVAFIPKNRPWAVAALLGLIADSRTIQMIYAFQSDAAIARNIEQLRPAVVVASADVLGDEVLAVLRARGIAAIAVEGMTVAAVPGLETAAATDDAGAPLAPEIQILTSGTTGPPKQCPFPYSLFARHHVLPVLGGGIDVDRSGEVPYLLSFPLGNISGMYTTLPTMVRGQRAVLVDRFTIDAWHDWVKRFRPVNGGLPPAGVQMILDRDFPPEDLASIKFVGTGAAPLDPTVQRNFEQRYGIPILLSSVGIGIGIPVAPAYPVYAAPPPVYYAPPPPVVYSPPVYYAPPPAYVGGYYGRGYYRGWHHHRHWRHW